jgi:hypothetical protein
MKKGASRARSVPHTTGVETHERDVRKCGVGGDVALEFVPLVVRYATTGSLGRIALT